MRRTDAEVADELGGKYKGDPEVVMGGAATKRKIGRQYVKYRFL